MEWQLFTERAFDTEAKDQPLALFAAPDPIGTPDLFGQDEPDLTPNADPRDICPACGAHDPMGEAVWHRNDCPATR
jgi:hypothetical protein